MSHFNYYAECRYTKCRHAECRGALQGVQEKKKELNMWLCVQNTQSGIWFKSKEKGRKWSLSCWTFWEVEFGRN